jgi:hypothetical protein
VDGRTDPRERLAHRAVPQPVHVIDAVGTGDHPRDQRQHLDHRQRARLEVTDVRTSIVYEHIRNHQISPGTPPDRD